MYELQGRGKTDLLSASPAPPLLTCTLPACKSNITSLPEQMS